MKPIDPIECVEESEMSPALDRRIRDLLCLCFPPDVPVFSQTRHWHGTAPEFSFVRREARKIVGHVGIVRRTIQVGSSRIVIAGVQNLAVAPDRRKSGLGALLMIRAMDEARRRGIPFGLLFCVPGLARFYCSLGWQILDRSFYMADETGARTGIPEKNIGMSLPLGTQPFPPGEVDLLGRDW
jgi:GNAT superfamily N-acetyltransferase